jgi:hypothetical protein
MDCSEPVDSIAARIYEQKANLAQSLPHVEFVGCCTRGLGERTARELYVEL